MKRLLVILLAIIILSTLTLGCITEEWETWQREVGERQRDGLPTNTPVSSGESYLKTPSSDE
jgi:hypothetical protein